MSLIEKALYTLQPNIKNIVEMPIITNSKKTVGYHSTIFDKNNYALSGGTHSNKLTARRIAIAECLERGLISEIRKNFSLKTDFLLDQIDSSLGFACGFEKTKTKFRSILEGVEKWAVSQVIDFKSPIETLNTFKLTDLAETMCSSFSKIEIYSKQISFEFIPDAQNQKVNFTLLVGYTDTGAFPGSVASFEPDDNITHAAIEAYRNFNNFQKIQNNQISATNIILKRIEFFGLNKDLAKRQICEARISKWSSPRIKLHKEYISNFNNIFLFRTLLHNQRAINTNHLERFFI